MYDIKVIFNYFYIKRVLDHRDTRFLFIHKLLYISQLWYMNLKKEPLFTNDVLVAKYGPLIEGIPVSDKMIIPEWDIRKMPPKELYIYLDTIYNNFGKLEDIKLLSYVNGSDTLWEKMQDYEKISMRVMMDYALNMRTND